ncbi:MAG: class I SAM-dependent methyltransferase family protein [Candidatus Aenigmarchaeota archaeon]|nr:class I SAM-dependent methyltransferase family protein [Candidatus Aenigmarchaeota archaeon]
MKPFKEALTKALEGRIDSRLVGLLPSGFQAVGDIAILNLRKELFDKGEMIGRSMLVLYPNLKTVCVKLDGVKGIERAPSLEKVAGDGTETIHRENGCLYKLDVTKVMFSKGNTLERGRLAGVVGKGEVVADMFAGVGYFSIPIAKAHVKKVYAIEINPSAFEYLEQNIELNNLKNVEPFCCDNRKAPEKLAHVADRVLMGYLPGTDKFLDPAFWFLKPSGGVIHFHNVYRDSELWNKPIKILEDAGRRHGMKLKILNKHIVKQYAPRMQHVVIDAEFRR